MFNNSLCKKVLSKGGFNSGFHNLRSRFTRAFLPLFIEEATPPPLPLALTLAKSDLLHSLSVSLELDE